MVYNEGDADGKMDHINGAVGAFALKNNDDRIQ